MSMPPVYLYRHYSLFLVNSYTVSDVSKRYLAIASMFNTILKIERLKQGNVKIL